MLRDVDRLPLAGKPGQDFDQPPQETVPRNEQEVEKHHGGEQPAGEASRPGKDARQNRSAIQRPGRASLRARGAEIIGRRQKCSKCIDRGIEKAQPLLNARNAFWQLGYPRFGGPRDGGAKSDNRRDHDKNEQNRSQRLGHTQSFKRAQRRLHQKIEHDREDHWQDDVSGDIGRRQNRKKENAAKIEGLRVGRQRHIRQ